MGWSLKWWHKDKPGIWSDRSQVSAWGRREWAKPSLLTRSSSSPGSPLSPAGWTSSSGRCRGCCRPSRESRQSVNISDFPTVVFLCHLLGVKIVLKSKQAHGNVSEIRNWMWNLYLCKTVCTLTIRILHDMYDKIWCNEIIHWYECEYLGSSMIVWGEATITEFQEMWNSDVTLIISDIWARTWASTSPIQ